MSYIRCLSNPEDLYIITLQNGNTQFFLKDGESVFMPDQVFSELLRKFVRQDCERHSIEGHEVYKQEKATLKFLATPEQIATYGKASGKDWKWFLEYEGWEKPIEMWEVTLHYIASSFEREYAEEQLTAQLETWLKNPEVQKLSALEALEAFKTNKECWFCGETGPCILIKANDRQKRLGCQQCAYLPLNKRRFISRRNESR